MDTHPAPSADRRVVVMTAGGTNPQAVINALAARFPELVVIREQPESKSTLVRRRARRVGWIAALGQLATMVASRLGKSALRRRTQQILAEHGLSAEPNTAVETVHVPSLNDPTCHAAVARLQPAVILTVSCRLLSRQTLSRISCPIVNLHAGINPMYRGQAGGYWALAKGDPGNFGATLHLVDAGVDTGDTLYEVRTAPEKGDSMLTYPLLLTAAAMPLTLRAVEDALEGRLSPHKAEGTSAMHDNPTIWTWIWNGIAKGLW
ncbi:formyl transferase [Rhizobium sp. YJ-22]|uniref:formyl transferase n=1 Tax=Rhizobium sp. YJ-22 TaxID=3037556 RepID=UPI002412293A|nr:formyl transferase [Rhizobium sp. YJ-22]MDG3575797.1 formyl transferase [Rhizobium sp. YJ-22]